MDRRQVSVDRGQVSEDRGQVSVDRRGFNRRELEGHRRDARILRSERVVPNAIAYSRIKKN